MSPPKVHIIGAGLSGLSTAIRLAESGRRVVIYESGPQAGGRCRSYFDDVLGHRIDNGNHLLLSGNRAVMRYLDTIGAVHSLVGQGSAKFPFVDLQTNERWTVSLNEGRLPLWIFDRSARLPNTMPSDYLSALKFAFARRGQTVEALLGRDSALFRRFWEPLAVAALNTAASEGEASLLWPVLKETFGRGGKHCQPLVARVGLSESFVDPAVAFLTLRGVRLFTNTRIREITIANNRAVALALAGGETVELTAADSVVVAVPPQVAATLLPGLIVPTESRPIVNAHFHLPSPPIDRVEITGVIGGSAEWIFHRGSMVSVTVSAADRFIDIDAASLASLLWADVVRALNLSDAALPRWRIVKEKRATFAQTPEQIRLRPKQKTAWRNITVAGDWTDTGLPATVEGAIRSGEVAAHCALQAA